MISCSKFLVWNLFLNFLLHKTVGQGWGPWGMIPTSPWNLNKNYLLANFFCSFHIILLLFYCSLNDNSFINTVFFLIISVFIIYLDNDKKINKTITLQFQIILPAAYQSLDFLLDDPFLVLTPLLPIDFPDFVLQIFQRLLKQIVLFEKL